MLNVQDAGTRETEGLRGARGGVEADVTDDGAADDQDGGC